MFKILKCSAIIFIMLLSVTQLSFATPTPTTNCPDCFTPFTWVDNVANDTDPLNNGNPDYLFTYDITALRNALNVLADSSNPFDPGSDVINSADLLLYFSASGSPTKTAVITLDLDTLTQTTFSFTSDANTDITLAGTALLQLNSDGTLDMKVHRNAGTFTLDKSVLTAYGCDKTDETVPPPSTVPEPSTFLLLGAGLLGVGLARKRMKK